MTHLSFWRATCWLDCPGIAIDKRGVDEGAGVRLRGMDIERPGRSGASSSGFDIGSGAQGFGVCDEGQSQSEWGQKCGRGTNIRSVRKSRVLVQEPEGCARLRVCDEGLEQLLGARVGDGKGFRVQGLQVWTMDGSGNRVTRV